jgi:hypothetical protein
MIYGKRKNAHGNGHSFMTPVSRQLDKNQEAGFMTM